MTTHNSSSRGTIVTHPLPFVLVLAGAGLLPSAALAQTGHIMTGVGAVNESMGGASVAKPLDASGTLHWNPGALPALGCCEVQFGFDLFKPTIELRSSITSPGSMSGSSGSRSDYSTIPSMAFTYHEDDSDLSFGLGAFGIGGFGVNYAASSTNPILMPQPNGFGQIYSRFQLLQVAPTVAYKIDESWSVGFAPTINQAQLSVMPASFAPPDNARGGSPTYPSASTTANAWGYGFQLGTYYRGGDGFSFGASYKSTQWFDTFKWNSANQLGFHRHLQFDMDFPSIVSLGLGYTDNQKWDVALDLRYIDYKNTKGFQAASFRPDGAVNGFGWDSIFVVAFGTQYKASDRLALRGGYTFNTNPISDENTIFNVPAPAIIQHHLSGGLTYKLRQNVALDVGFTYGFQNSISGPIKTAMGTAPGSSVTSEMSTYSLLFGIRINF